MAVRKVWRVPWTTHSDLLPHLAGIMPPELFFEKRAISFIKLLLNSNNSVVNMITGMGLYGSHSIIGQNFKYLNVKYDLSKNNVTKSWDRTCQSQTNKIRLSEQIKELCYLRDRVQNHLLDRAEIKNLIDILCTE